MSGKCDAKDGDEVDEIQGRDDPSTMNEVATTIHIAPPSVSEKNDRRAVRCRTRRRRPEKLRIDDIGDDTKGGGSKDDREELRITYEPDIASFVSGCIPGVSLSSSSQRGTTTPTHRRRSLPLLSFLSSTHLAAAEKKRRKEDIEIRNAIAEEEARKALLLNPIEPTGGGQKSDTTSVNVEKLPTQSKDGPRAGTYTTTIAIERTSNILMPPLLKDFLNDIGK
jgi:hypothetical protein